MTELAAALGVDRRCVGRILVLATLAPDSVDTIVEWREPNGTAPTLAAGCEIPEHGDCVPSVPPAATGRNVGRPARARRPNPAVADKVLECADRS
jgi:hypothetical protein